MKINFSALSLLVASAFLPVLAAQPGFMTVADQRRVEVRDAVEAHRAATRDEVRREEAAAGRRLTPAELAQLRQQVRQNWSPRHEVAQSAESLPAERVMPVPGMKGAALSSPSSQRP
jgi:hypothetical protein